MHTSDRVIHIIHNFIHRLQLSDSAPFSGFGYQSYPPANPLSGPRLPDQGSYLSPQRIRGMNFGANDRSETPLQPPIPERSFAADLGTRGAAGSDIYLDGARPGSVP
ncbi:hypothetical protein GCM10009764_27870 [Nocardia ninae]|uniref:Uncharacterized protein n=1 Tax=Nocardia ninae NBRC 108245 TaxID=1210091 RepID=A0A511MMK6_9NOCA|nr:hypothetical protein NN4_59370 [Nocardia ninae NBRC 108245]